MRPIYDVILADQEGFTCDCGTRVWPGDLAWDGRRDPMDNVFVGHVGCLECAERAQVPFPHLDIVRKSMRITREYFAHALAQAMHQVATARELVAGVREMKASEDEVRTLRSEARYLRGLAYTKANAFDLYDSDSPRCIAIARKLELVADILVPGEAPGVLSEAE